MVIFPRWPVIGLFRTVKLYGLTCVTGSYYESETQTTESKVHALSRTSSKFHLDLFIPRYSNSPQVSCLGMNPRGGWNPDLEETYLPQYSEFEAEMFTHGTSGFYLQPMKMSIPDTSSIPRYRECTKTTCFSILGFFRPGVKLGFDFPEVLPNQKSRTWSLKFYFDEESNPMPGSLKNSSSIKIPNFLQQKLKMLGIRLFFNRKMFPSM